MVDYNNTIIIIIFFKQIVFLQRKRDIYKTRYSYKKLFKCLERVDKGLKTSKINHLFPLGEKAHDHHI